MAQLFDYNQISLYQLEDSIIQWFIINLIAKRLDISIFKTHYINLKA